MTSAIGASEFSLVLLLTVLVVVPIAAVAFARSGKGLEELGKGQFSIDRDDDLGSGMTASDASSAAERDRVDEVRQMLEAADFRSQARGEGRIDVEREIERLLAGEEAAATSSGRAGARSGSEAGDGSGEPGRTGGQDPPEVGDPHPTMETGVRAEVRQLVIANNERRERRGEEPLDVETEVERRMKEWG